MGVLVNNYEINVFKLAYMYFKMVYDMESQHIIFLITGVKT